MEFQNRRSCGFFNCSVANGVVYVGSGDNNIYALNASTGTVVWSYTTGGDVASSPAVADDMVFAGSYDGKVYALNASNGALWWSYLTGDMVVSSPAVANGVVYVGSYDHVVYAFGASPSRTYTVTFTASGLPSETSWSVTFNSETQTSTSDSIVFNVPNGIYPFAITPPTGYVASPISGTANVNFADMNEKINFALIDATSTLLVPLLLVVITLVAALSVATVHRKKIGKPCKGNV